MRRVAILLLCASVFGASITLSAAPSRAQNQPVTGIAVTVADWLQPWEAEAGGGWIYVASNQAIKDANPVAGANAAVPPGICNLYWVQNADLAPLLFAEDVAVVDGDITEIRVATGVILETADWVAPRDPVSGWFGAIPPSSNTLDFVNRTRASDPLFLPVGRYDLFFMQDETDNIPAIWLGTFEVEPPFGGLGVEVGEQDGAIVVVRTLPGGPAESAGIQAGGILAAIDGTTLAGLSLEEAVALCTADREATLC